MNSATGSSIVLRTAVVLALIGAAPVAAAADAKDSLALEEVVVTATKVAEDIGSAPAAITAITADALGPGGIQEVRDLAMTVPNLSVGDQFGVNRTAAGVVNMVTKKPTEDPDGHLDYTLGNYALTTFEGALGGPIAGETVMGRISGKAEKRNGYGENLATGRPVDKRDAYAVRGSLRFKSSDTLDIVLMGDYFKEDDYNYAFHFFGTTVVPENGLAHNFFFVDRIKDAIRRRGENISSFEVEAEIVRFPAVREAAAVAVPSELGEDEVMAIVAPAPGHTIDPAALLEFLRGRLAYFMIPRYVRVLPELPKTPSAKVLKADLRRQGITADTWDRAQTGIVIRRDRIGS